MADGATETGTSKKRRSKGHRHTGSNETFADSLGVNETTSRGCTDKQRSSKSNHPQDELPETQEEE